MRVIARQVLHRLAMGHPERLERLRGMAAEAVLVVGTPGRKGIPCKLNLAENVTAYRSIVALCGFPGRFGESTTSDRTVNPRFVSTTWKHVPASAS